MDREENGRGLCVCEISLFEIAMLMKRGRLDPGVPYREFMETVLDAGRYDLVGFGPEIAARAVELPEHVNKDPADRFIVATAAHHHAKLATADRNLQECGEVVILW